jgi:UDP-N-acetylglucosamine--N-acetylmuramyl-(pentapeptide) pyrophosphoryl-undecaprenol N-acetylglucosamine transferase
MAGGTGGHVYPALAVAEQLRAQGMDVSWLGTRKGLEARLVPARGLEIDWIRAEGLRRSGWWRMLRAPLVLSGACWEAGRVLRRRRPCVVLGMGGFVSGPGGLMARLLGIPLVVHEQNSVPGLTNRWLARIASRVLEAFSGSFGSERRALACGNPVRPEIADLPEPALRFAERTGPFRLLVLGGSLGAQALNAGVPAALALLPRDLRPRVRHQTGQGKQEVTEAAYAESGVEAEVQPFLEDMAGAYAWADLVICRSGALTVSELAAAGLGALLVPYPYAVDDHQTRNGAYLADAGAARLLAQTESSPERLASELQTLLTDRARLLEMAEAARRLAQPESARRVAAVCREFCS